MIFVHSLRSLYGSLIPAQRVRAWDGDTCWKSWDPRPGLINLQSVSGAISAEANINYSFSTSEIWSEPSGMQYFVGCTLHSSRGTLKQFPENLRVFFPLECLFDKASFPRYLLRQVHGTLKSICLQSSVLFQNRKEELIVDDIPIL